MSKICTVMLLGFSVKFVADGCGFRDHRRWHVDLAQVMACPVLESLKFGREEVARRRVGTVQQCDRQHDSAACFPLITIYGKMGPNPIQEHDCQEVR
jgi:hypothetical protein